MVGFTAILIWVQMGSLLKMLVAGGSEAMTIEAWALGSDSDDGDDTIVAEVVESAGDSD